MANHQFNNDRRMAALRTARELTNHTIVRTAEAAAILGITVKHLHTLTKESDFPAKIKLGSHAVGWRVLDLENWIDSKKENQTLTTGGQKDVL